MITTTITWHAVADGKLPDVETNVLLGLSDGFTCEGFLYCDGAGEPVWLDVCAVPLDDGVVTHWADMPASPAGATR